METKLAFEFGAGFSTRVILKALETTGGKLISCDITPMERIRFLNPESISHKENWRFIHGDSSAARKELKDEVFDFVLHDADHEWQVVAQDIKNIVPRIKKNGILIIHDTDETQLNYELHKSFSVGLQDYKHSKVTLPYGYGLTIVRIEEDFGLGAVELQWRRDL